MELGFSQIVNNLLLDNMDEDIPMTKSSSTPVKSHQNFKEKIIPVFQKYDEVTFNQLRKELLSQYPPKSTYLENKNNLITTLRNHIHS